MANEQTAMAFHDAKSKFEARMDDFKRAAETDERDLKEEVLESVWNIFGEDFATELQRGE